MPTTTLHHPTLSAQIQLRGPTPKSRSGPVADLDGTTPRVELGTSTELAFVRHHIAPRVAGLTDPMLVLPAKRIARPSPLRL